MSPESDFAAELPRHLGALRSLACALVGNAAADDVVQEAAYQALRSPPRRPGPVGGWLAGVLRNVARRHRRGQARRLRHEAAATPVAESACSAESTAGHVETLQILTQCLAELPEQYQRVVVARYLHEQAPATIAEQAGEPLETVKTRLKRGLEMLRGRCAARMDADNWRGRLMVAFAIEQPATAMLVAGSIGGITIMANWWTGGAAAIALAAGLWWWSQPTVAAPPSGAGAQDSGLQAVAAELPVSARQEEERSHANLAAAGDVPDPTTQLTIVGRCVDEQGAPLAGVSLRLLGQVHGNVGDDRYEQHAANYRQWVAAHPQAPWRDVEHRSASDGSFAMAAPAAPVGVQLMLRHQELDYQVFLASSGALSAQIQPLLGQRGASSEPVQWSPGSRIDLGDLRLPTRCLLRLRVVDERGEAIRTPHAQLLPASPPGTGPAPRRGQQMAIASSAGLVVAAHAGNWQVSLLFREIVAGDQCEIPNGVTEWAHTVVVRQDPAVETIEGRVVDVDGRPLAGVSVVGVGRGRTFARTDTDGQFVLHRLGFQPAAMTLEIYHEHYSLASGNLRVQWGERELEFAMAPLGSMTVVVREDATGKFLRDVAVWYWPDLRYPPSGRTVDLLKGRREGADEQGRITLPVPAGRYLVLVESLAGWHARSELQPVAVVAGGDAVLEVRLRPAVTRWLQVLRPDGAAAAGAGVELLAAGGPLQEGAVGVELHRLHRWSPDQAPFANVLAQTGVTDAEGRCELRGAPDLPMVVRISPPGRPAWVAGPESLAVEEPWLVALPGGSKVTLRLEPPEFLAAFTSLQQAAGTASPSEIAGFRLVRGDRRNQESIPAAEQPPVPPSGNGILEFAEVPAGPWSLQLDWHELVLAGAQWTALGKAVVAGVTVPPGRELSLPVDLREWLPVTVQGRVWSAGKPVASRQVTLHMQRPDAGGVGVLSRRIEFYTDEEGRFTFRGRPGTIAVEARIATAGDTSHPLRSPEQAVLPGEQRELEFVLQETGGR